MWLKTKGKMAAAPQTVTVEKTVRSADGAMRREVVIQPTNGVAHGRTPEQLCEELFAKQTDTIDFPLAPSPRTNIAMGKAEFRGAGDDKTLVAWPLNSCASVIYVDGTNFGSKAYIHHAPAGILKAKEQESGSVERKSGPAAPGDIEVALIRLGIRASQAYVIYAHSNLNEFGFYDKYIRMLVTAGVLESRIVQIQLDSNFCGFGITPDRVLCWQ